MCYKVHTPRQDELQGYFQKQAPPANQLFKVDEFPHYYHADGFTNPHLPITTTEEPYRVQLGVWKLIPHWIKTAADAKKYANTLNATCEDIFEKPSYRSYIGESRCLLWVKGFFEPHHPVPPREENESDADYEKRKTKISKITIPYYIHQLNDEPFSMGCVFSNWLNHDTGEIMKTFSIITTPANYLVGLIHNEKKRMPLIITPDNRQKWLSRLPKDEIKAMMVPLPDGILDGYQVSNLVYKKGVDANIPEAIQRVDL